MMTQTNSSIPIVAAASQTSMLSTKNSRSKVTKLQPVPTALSTEERKLAQLEAACAYYRDLIELKLRHGEEVADDDPLVLKLTDAKDAFQ